jgi:pheromone shutdown protein TraB
MLRPGLVTPEPKVLPGVQAIKGQHADFYLVGTRSSGAADVALVEQALEAVRPDVVVAEMCPTRMQLHVTRRSVTSSSGMSFFQFANKRCRHFMLQCISVFMGLQLDEVQDFGAEQRAAVMLAAERNIRVVLGDREIWCTLLHCWCSLSWQQRIALTVSSMTQRQVLHAQDQRTVATSSDVLTEVLRRLSKSYPPFLGLLREQERYLASSLYRLDLPLGRLISGPSSAGAENMRGTVLVVLGRGRQTGVLASWGELQSGSQFDRATVAKAPTAGYRGCGPLCFVISVGIAIFALAFVLVFLTIHQHYKIQGDRELSEISLHDMGK